MAPRQSETKAGVAIHSRPKVNDVVQVQNQRGPHANKWELSGKVVETQDFDANLLKMDGSGRITRRNRRFLCKIVPFHQEQLTKLSPILNNELVREIAPPNNAATPTEPKSLPVSDHDADTQTEIPMSDDVFNSGLTDAVKRVQQESNTQPSVTPKSAIYPTSNFNTWEKRVKFATSRYIEQC